MRHQHASNATAEANGQAPEAQPAETIAMGLTTRDVAQRYRVGEDKVRAWIARGELAAVNTATTLCGKPRWVVLPEALAEFERRRRGGPAEKLKARRRRQLGAVDYFAD
jgi:transposase